MSPESQTESAIRVYDARAATYEDSWHPSYSQRLTKLLPIKSDDRILVLCCGTGLDAFLAAEAAGPGGMVVAVDVSPGMLAQAQLRQDKLHSHITFVRHDVTDLESCEDLRDLKGSFNMIICSNAFVLFAEPTRVVRNWKGWLQEGGRMAIDVTHERNFIGGLIIERATQQLGITWPSNRQWIKNEESFKVILEDEGMKVEKVVLVEKIPGASSLSYGADEADDQFEFIVKSPFSAPFTWTDGNRDKAKDLFRKEWESIAVDGKVHSTEALYLYVAVKL
ncbi:S-adenosyl-L-methionine-dependent methyltransferase [Xylariales sp. PMI_506]|nr:S-adenosyl-L-methionine-dependent methyltransferase [Xylariales sp. PMI_506]